MAKQNGHGKSVEAQLVDSLKQLTEKLEAGLERLHQDSLNTHLRLDKVIENTGAHWRRLEERVAELEKKAG